MIDRPRVEAVCFDLDDTLFDFSRYVRAGLEEAACLIERRTGRRLHDELLALYFDEGVTEDTFDVLLERHGLDDDLVPELVEAYHDSTGALEPYPDAEPVLSALAPRYRLGVLTDGRNGRDKLERLGMADRFDVVLVTPNLDFTKRDVEAFEHALEALSVEGPEAVYVGDNPLTDFAGATEVGMTTVRLMRGRFTGVLPPEGAIPDFEITTLRELHAILGIRGTRDGPADRATDPRTGR